MTTIAESTTPALVELPARVARVQAFLAEQFQAPFSLWEFDGHWNQISDAGSLTLSETCCRPEVLAKALDGQPVVMELQHGHYLLVVNVGRVSRKTLVAAAEVNLDAGALLGRLASASVDRLQKDQLLRERQQLADAYARQVSLDFEELTWLRNLAEYLQFCDVTSERDDVAENVLPPLRQVIQAQALVTIAATDFDQSASFTPSSIGPVVFWTGERVVDDVTCCRLVEWATQEFGLKPTVRNGVQTIPALSEFEGIESFILMPAVKHGICTGWLLALNRVTHGLSDSPHTFPRTACSESEFGTFEANLIAAAAVMLATHAWNRELYEERESLLIGVVRALINAMDAKDSYTCGHSDRVALMARRLGLELGLSNQDCEKLYMSGLLHDVGKIGVPDEVLSKDGPLTAQEFELIKQHPVIGHRILRHLSQLSYALPGVLYHHESIDGSGYPEGLKGDQIPLEARILAVVDAFDAMTSSRPYREAMPVRKAEAILRAGAGQQWDAAAVDAYFRVRSELQEIRKKSFAHTQSILCVPTTNGTPRLAVSDAIVTAVTASRG